MTPISHYTLTRARRADNGRQASFGVMRHIAGAAFAQFNLYERERALKRAGRSPLGPVLIAMVNDRKNDGFVGGWREENGVFSRCNAIAEVRVSVGLPI